jgi:hypothetical protein
MEGFKIEIQTSREHSRSKDWYLLKKGHHTGPFARREILRQIEQKEISGQDQVWKPGLDNWIHIENLEEFYPTPPPLPVAEEKVEERPIAVEEVVGLEPEVKNSPFKYALLLVPFMVIGFIYYYLTIPPKRFLPFTRLDKVVVSKLNNQILDKNFKGELILSKDGRELWLATGREGLFHVELVLNSIDGEILSARKVRVVSKTRLEQNWARFNVFDLEYGTKIVPGKYAYSLIARPLGPKEKLDKFIKKMRKAPVGSEDFTLSGEILFTRDSREEFTKKLTDYKKKLMSYKLAPYKERLEKWQAFMSVLTKVDVLYQDTLGAIKRGKSINLFEVKYNQYLGSMLRSLILEMREVYKSGAKNSNEYKKLYLYGRQIGEMVSDMMVKTKRYKVLGPAPKGRLSRYFLKKTKGFKETAEKEIGLLQDKIKSFEKS